MYLLSNYKRYSSDIYYWLLVVLAAALPFAPYIITLCQILLVFNWLLEGNILHKLKMVYLRKSLFIFLIIYFLHIIWCIGSHNPSDALHELKIKLPLLVIPLIIGTSEMIQAHKVIFLLKVFIASVTLATFISTLIYFEVIPYKIHDIREISVFISHIRLSLLVVIAILTLLHWVISEPSLKPQTIFLYFVLAIWLFSFLILLKSLTGILVFTIATAILIVAFLNTINNPFLKVGLAVLLYAIPFFTAMFTINAYNKYYYTEKVDFKKLDRATVNGNLYTHDTTSSQVENGHYVWIYICHEELVREWNRRSKIPFSGIDNKNQTIEYTILRYMTSKGLRKDSLGVTMLTPKDIQNIEKGYTNFIFSSFNRINARLYEVIWEIDQYKHGASPDGHSIAQRIVYSKIAISLIKKNFWFGIGTGNIPSEYKHYYTTHDTKLSKFRWWLTHNEYLRLFAIFGIFGFLIIISAFILPAWFERKWSSYYFVMIFIITFVSFIFEDTLETQIGATFVAFFYSFFLWGCKKRFVNIIEHEATTYSEFLPE